MTLLLLLLTATGGSFCHAQEVIDLVNHDTVYVSNCRTTSSTLRFSGHILDSIDFWVFFDGDGQAITITPNIQSQSLDVSLSVNYHITLWDGSPSTGTVLHNSTYSQQVYFPTSSFTANSGTATLHIQADSSLHSCYNIINWHTPSTASYCTSAPDAFHIENITDHSVDIVWAHDGHQVCATIGNTVVYGYGDTLHIDGLEANQSYTADVCLINEKDHPCCHALFPFLTNPVPHIGCPDLANLNGDYVRAYYGNTSNPYKNIGLADGRHLVCTDTSERDPRTDNQLRTVYPGMSSSVRLGNNLVGSGAEALSYSLHIDTTYYALFLMHYAVVLQNPDHSYEAQPRFKFEILDSANQIIDPACGAADYHASSSLGWNSYYGTLWKDWTTVGYDLTPYHGQDVTLRFTTYDCTEGGHFGYAYFSSECRLKVAEAQYCASADSNVMTAPDGFYYLWYYDDPTDTVSTNQTVHFTNNDALLNCRLISTENPNCYVTLNTYAGHRYAQAVIDTLATESLGCDGHRVYFTNRSTVINDAGTSTGEPCESAIWYFGDGHISFEYSPVYTYRDSGDYTVRMIASIAGGQCSDTTEYIVHIPDFYIPVTKDTFACDSIVFGGAVYTHDTLGPSYRIHHTNDCDTLVTLDLHVIPYISTLLEPDTFCYRDPYHWRGQTAGEGHDTITRPAHSTLVDTLTSASGCDSLVVLPLVQMPPPPLTFHYEPDCQSNTYTLHAVTDLPFLQWSSEPADPLVEGHEADNPIAVKPYDTILYTLLADTTATFDCPAVGRIRLAPIVFPEARLTVQPEALTYDHPLLTAHDNSRRTTRRQWILVPYPGADSLRPAESGPTLSWQAPLVGLDSLTVVLAIGDNYCADTASRTVPFVRHLLWAPNIFVATDPDSRFAPVATGLTAAVLSIYNRQGLLVHRTDNLATGWDGTRDGTPCPQGAYVWHLRYQSDLHPGIWRTATGTVTLVR